MILLDHWQGVWWVLLPNLGALVYNWFFTTLFACAHASFCISIIYLDQVVMLAQELCSTATTVSVSVHWSVMMRRLVTCALIALLSFCLHLKGCGSGATKCACNRRLETAGRVLSARRRRTIDNTEYSEVCCDDWDPGSTVTEEPWNSLDAYSDESQEEFNNVLDQISRRRYVTQSTMIESTTAEGNTTESPTATTTVG